MNDTEAILENVSRDGEAIVFDWADSVQSRWTPSQLRRDCPCATCREKRRGEDDDESNADPIKPVLPVLTVQEARPVSVETLRPVGNYAYNVIFSDGHHSGLFTLSMLRRHPEN